MPFEPGFVTPELVNIGDLPLYGEGDRDGGADLSSALSTAFEIDTLGDFDLLLDVLGCEALGEGDFGVVGPEIIGLIDLVAALKGLIVGDPGSIMSPSKEVDVGPFFFLISGTSSSSSSILAVSGTLTITVALDFFFAFLFFAPRENTADILK